MEMKRFAENTLILRTSRARRWSARGVTVIVLALATCFVLSSGAIATVPIRDQPVGAPLYPPYPGTTTITPDLSQTGCSYAHLGVALHFSLATGIGGWRGAAGAHSCASSNANNAAAGGEIQARIPMTFSSTGITTVEAVWNITDNFAERITPGTCFSNGVNQTCSVEAEVNSYACGYFYNDTSGSYLNGTNSTCTFGFTNQSYDFTTCTHGSCVSAVGGGATVQPVSVGDYFVNLTGPFSASCSYTLILYIYGDDSVYVDHSAGATLHGASAYARLDFGYPGAPGNGATLPVIT
jgi:hypothetical protein